MPECRCATINLLGQEGGGLWNLGISINISKNMLKTQEKEAPQGNILEIFLLNTVKNYILNGKFNPKMGTIRAFLSKIGTTLPF